MLTPQQQLVVETWNQGIAVMAGAGSGKTYTLVKKVKKLLETKPDARFAAVSFTEKSAKDLREKLTSLSLEVLGRALQGQWVTTIHGLCSSIIREYPREAGLDGDEMMLSESESTALWDRATRSLWFDELPSEVSDALDRMLKKESQASLLELILRIRNLYSLGILDELKSYPDLRTVSAYVLERYDRTKRRQGALDFNDLEWGASQALTHTHVRSDYQKRFDLVMVDEFQDTNPIQALILTAFSKPGLTNLCVVGDPKQSIYRFRDADVSVFEDFCAKMPVHVELTLNFRSVPGVLEFCNQVCEPAFLASEMSYQPLKPALPDDPLIPPVESLLVQSPEGLVAWIKNEQSRGIDLSQMALLLRKIRGKPEKWLKALTSAGIPIAIESGGLLWSDPRARELCALLKWWSNPGNEYSGAVFLRAPWCGVPDLSIDQWRKLDPSFVQPFFASLHPLAILLKPLFENKLSVRPGEVLMELLKDDRVEQEMGPTILALWHRCEEMSQRGYDFQKVVLELSQALEDSRRERSVPPPKNLGLLRVMTIHGSKGLEFPHVILIDFPEKAARASDMPLLFWDRTQGVFVADRDIEGNRIKDSEAELTWRKWEQEKALAEDKRVLYVALTRAQKRILCVLPTATDPAAVESISKHRAKIENVYLKDYWRAWVESPLASFKQTDSCDLDVNVNATPFKKMDLVPLQREKPAFLPKLPRHSVSEWNQLEKKKYVTHPAQRETRQERAHLMEDTPELEFSEIGTQVHRLLELGDETGLMELEKKLGKSIFAADPLIHWMRRSTWMRDSSLEFKVWKEFAFEIPVGDEILVGAIDRLVFDGDFYTLIDFKFTQNPKSDAELLAAYQTQLNLYAWSIMRLEPKIESQRLKLVIINICSEGVREVVVPLLPSRLDVLKDRAVALVRETKVSP
jgi:ATP-dependent exoDNAse (exonuclease V) beta subunit